MNNNSSIAQHSSHIIEYLIQKLDSRIKTLALTRSAFNNILDIQDLIDNKYQMHKHLNDLEDDIKQSIAAIKALLAENKYMFQELQTYKTKHTQAEEKLKCDLNLFNEVNQQNNLISQENEILRENVKDYRDKLTYVESEFIEKETQMRECMKMLDNANQEIEKLKQENLLLQMQVSTQEELVQEQEKKTAPPQEDLQNVQEILSERIKKKKIISDKIKSHMGNQSIDVIKEGENDVEDNNPQANEKEVQSGEILTKNIKETKENSTSGSSLIIRALGSPDNIKLLNQHLGNDFMQKLLSKDVTSEFVSQVEKILDEAESKKLQNIPEKGSKDHVYKFDDEIMPLSSYRSYHSNSKSKEGLNYIRSIVSNNNNQRSGNSLSKSKEKKPLMKSKSAIYLIQDKTFEGSLRDYPVPAKEKKIFNNYTCPYGKCFNVPEKPSRREIGSAKLNRSESNIKHILP